MSYDLWGQTLRIEDKTPLYRQLEQILMDYIEAEKLAPGDPIPGENELCQRFSLSRTTVRQTLRQLQERGLILRRRGLGSFLAEPKVSRSLNSIYSFTDQLGGMGFDTSSVVLQFCETQMDGDLARRLGLSSGLPVYYIERVRLANGKPMLLEKTTLVRRFCPALTRKQAEKDSLYQLLTQNGLRIASAIESYEPIVMEKSLQKLMKCKDAPSAFSITRRGYTEGGELFEYTQSVMPGRRSRLEVTLLPGGMRMEHRERD